MKDSTIHTCQQYINKYISRKEVYKKAFYKRTKEIDARIRYWRNCIIRAKKREERIKWLISATNKFFKTHIEYHKFDSNTCIARFCYYKYGLENNISNGKYLSEAIDRGAQEAAKRRKTFTRKFKDNVEIKDKYHSFKSHIDKFKKPS